MFIPDYRSPTHKHITSSPHHLFILLCTCGMTALHRFTRCMHLSGMINQWRTEGLQRPPPRRIGLHGWRLRGSGCPPPLRLVNPASATALCNEVTLLICLGLIFFLQLGPTSWAGAPSKACARGPWPSLPPPSARHCDLHQRMAHWE